MKKNTWIPLLFLALFIFFIYLIFNLLFSTGPIHRFGKASPTHPTELPQILEELRQAEKKIGYAILHLERIEELWVQLEVRAEPIPPVFRAGIDTGMTHIALLHQSMTEAWGKLEQRVSNLNMHPD